MKFKNLFFITFEFINNRIKWKELFKRLYWRRYWRRSLFFGRPFKQPDIISREKCDYVHDDSHDVGDDYGESDNMDNDMVRPEQRPVAVTVVVAKVELELEPPEQQLSHSQQSKTIKRSTYSTASEIKTEI